VTAGSAGERVEALRHRFGEEVARAFDAACAVEEPAGSSAAWLELCARWGVAPLDDAERAQVRAALSPLFGAPAPELHAVAAAIAREIRVSTRKISTFDVPRDVEAAHERLLAACDRLADDLVSAYRALVLPKRRGMFANVMKHHDASAKSVYESPMAHSMRCNTCGAPKMGEQGFECVFCGGHMAERGGGRSS
jgi:hypothetical protein